MKMKEILYKKAIRSKVKSANKKQLLQDIANLASEHVGIPYMNIAKSLQQREILGPTGTPLRAWIELDESVEAGQLPLDTLGLGVLGAEEGNEVKVRPLLIPVVT